MKVRRLVHYAVLSLTALASLLMLPAPAAAAAWSAVSDLGRDAADRLRLIKDQGSTDLYGHADEPQ
ncbi:MAG: hypothetical protein ABWY05_08050 [Noviherbaspirillum sp.]